jgi:hypothetical protein
MWVLLVISYITDFDEYKVTEFHRYSEQLHCEVSEAVLTSQFEENEIAKCVYFK